MKRDTLSVMMASGLGALLGSFAALEMARWFGLGSFTVVWGILFGAVVGWCAVDFRHLLQSFKQAFWTVVKWRPNKPYWKAVGLGYAWVFSCMFPWFCIIACLLAWAMVASINYDHTLKGKELVPVALFVYGAIGSALLACLLTGLVGFSEANMGKAKGTLADVISQHKSGLREANFLAVLVRIVSWVVEWIITVGEWLFTEGIPNIPWALKKTGVGALLTIAFVIMLPIRLCIPTFRIAHSSRRRICFIASAIGGTVGFFLGSTLIGAMVGAFVGAVEHELIAVRWLKLVPVRA